MCCYLCGTQLTRVISNLLRVFCCGILDGDRRSKIIINCLNFDVEICMKQPILIYERHISHRYLVLFIFESNTIYVCSLRHKEEINMKRLFSFRCLRSKNLFGFSLVIILTVIFGVYNLWAVLNVNKDTLDMVDKDLELLIANQKLASSMSNRVGAVRGYAADGDQSYKDLFIDETEQMEDYQQKIIDLSSSDEVAEVLARL